MSLLTVVSKAEVPQPTAQTYCWRTDFGWSSWDVPVLYGVLIFSQYPRRFLSWLCCCANAKGYEYACTGGEDLEGFCATMSTRSREQSSRHGDMTTSVNGVPRGISRDISKEMRAKYLVGRRFSCGGESGTMRRWPVLWSNCLP